MAASDMPDATANPYAPPRAVVRDLADPSLTLVPAERGTRLVAAILDGIIGGAMIYLPMLVAIVIGAAFTRMTDDTNSVMIALVAGGVLALIGFVAWCWLTVKYVKANGQSIAKKLLSIKVVRLDGSPVSLGRIFWLRNVVNGLLGIIPLYGFVEVMFIFAEDRRCLHDKIADTIVIKA